MPCAVQKLTPFIALFLLLSLNAPVSSTSSLKNNYVGSQNCVPCHQQEYSSWKTSGHSQIMHRSSDPEVALIPHPEGYTAKDITYVIGGYKWKTLFLDREGFIITTTFTGKGKNQYNIKSRRWADFQPGQKTPYDCGRCHSTGYSPEGHQDGLRGIVGTWKFKGIQCEACHGPGALHSKSTLKTDIKVDRDVCVQCHSTKPLDTIPLNGVFLDQYSEANQLIKSKMKVLACVDCHNPHLASARSIKQSCESCHLNATAVYKGSYMFKLGVTCVDCHMPPVEIIAEGNAAGNGKMYDADFKSHLFKIDHRKDFPVAIMNNQRVSPGYLSVDYACMRCHSIFHNRQWAASFALFAHRIKITTDIKIMRLQMAAAYMGFLFSIITLVTALSLKNWIRPKANKKKLLSIHKHVAWITFALYIFISTLCIYFHSPLGQPLKFLDLGWFLIHPINGLIGLALYSGKVLAVRKYKTGWKSPGLIWGTALFIFWLTQLVTVIFRFQI